MRSTTEKLENTMSERATAACLAGEGMQLDLSGVADCAGTLLAASLLLAEGLGQRSAGRTLERAVAAVLTMNETMNGLSRERREASPTP